MSVIYRIQNSEGKGPYNLSDLDVRSWIDNTTKHNGDQCPGPWEDEGIAEYWDDLCRRALSKKFKFGFKTLEQMLEWFSETEIERLKEFGFDVVEIPLEQVSELIEGQKQVMFTKVGDV